MKLSELKNGEQAKILKVMGHGGFRKRIMEMGFLKGKVVESLLNAPLQDPIKYGIMGYEVSLRREEAKLIEIQPLSPAAAQEPTNPPTRKSSNPQTDDASPSLPTTSLQEAGKTINVALVGNPNSGKTSLFNFASGAHARVGNYSGVTVDASQAHTTYGGYNLELTDLPGTYSLTCYSPEELYVRHHLFRQHPDVIITVLDSTNLERNLYLTTQLVDMNLPVVCALNMYDEFQRRGDTLNI
ncbi:MAG: 50S ribosome-binding GTPase, partial [Alloprevotella sp.]|nr:50S ribosome-binding GTPase [Alloprevotella sp.]